MLEGGYARQLVRNDRAYSICRMNIAAESRQTDYQSRNAAVTTWAINRITFPAASFSSKCSHRDHELSISVGQIRRM